MVLRNIKLDKETFHKLRVLKAKKDYDTYAELFQKELLENVD